MCYILCEFQFLFFYAKTTLAAQIPMKLKVDLTVYAPGESMFIGGENPPILTGILEIVLTSKLVLSLIKGYVSLNMVDVNWIMHARIQSSKELGDDVDIVAVTNLPKKNPLDVISWLINKKGFMLDKKAAKQYERTIGSIE